MCFPKRLRHLLLATCGATALVIATVVGVLAYPQPLYAFHVEKGRLHLYSDRPFDQALGRAVLVEVERRLTQSPAELSLVVRGDLHQAGCLGERRLGPDCDCDRVRLRFDEFDSASSVLLCVYLALLEIGKVTG